MKTDLEIIHAKIESLRQCCKQNGASMSEIHDQLWQAANHIEAAMELVDRKAT